MSRRSGLNLCPWEETSPSSVWLLPRSHRHWVRICIVLELRAGYVMYDIAGLWRASRTSSATAVGLLATQVSASRSSLISQCAAKTKQKNNGTPTNICENGGCKEAGRRLQGDEGESENFARAWAAPTLHCCRNGRSGHVGPLLDSPGS